MQPDQRHKPPNSRYEAFGEAKSLAAWSNDPRCALSLSTLEHRVRQGIPLEAAMLFSRGESHSKYWAFGETRTLGQWLRDPRCTIRGSVLKQRMESGERFESAITRPESEPLLDRPFQYGSDRPGLPGEMLALEDLWRVAKLRLFGETKTASKWSLDPRCEVSLSTLYDRIRQGWPEDERILLRTASALFPDPFAALTAEGLDLGCFPNIRSAETAILAISQGGTIYDRIMKREITIPRAKVGRNPSRSELQLTAWGETKSAAEWSRDPRCVVRQVTLYARLRTKNEPWTPEAALSKPADGRFVSEAHELRAKLYAAFGETKTLKEWAADPRCTVRETTLANQISKGVPLERALGTPPKLRSAFGEHKTLAQWSRDPRCEVSYSVLKSRFYQGLPLEVALKP